VRRPIIVLSLVAVLVLALILNAVFDSKIAGAVGVVALLLIALFRFTGHGWLPGGGDDDFDVEV
jgi:hypothetical protein